MNEGSVWVSHGGDCDWKKIVGRKRLGEDVRGIRSVKCSKLLRQKEIEQEKTNVGKRKIEHCNVPKGKRIKFWYQAHKKLVE